MVKLIDPRPKSIDARFEHLSSHQRNHIYHVFEEMIAAVQFEDGCDWPTLNDFNWVKNRLAEHYGVSPWTIMLAWNHVRVWRGST